jgi:hypothetical protein
MAKPAKFSPSTLLHPSELNRIANRRRDMRDRSARDGSGLGGMSRSAGADDQDSGNSHQGCDRSQAAPAGSPSVSCPTTQAWPLSNHSAIALAAAAAAAAAGHDACHRVPVSSNTAASLSLKFVLKPSSQEAMRGDAAHRLLHCV